MIGEILAIGTELLLGSTTNTNAQFLSERLTKLGVDVCYHTVVGDNIHQITDAINISLKRADIIIITGGLGPTQDDITKEAVCNALNIELDLNKDILNNIKQYFDQNNIKMTDNNIKQAYVPKECTVLNNDIGTAPGFLIKTNQKTIVLLPGPPKEMKTMFVNYAETYLKQEQIIISKTIKTIGIGESTLEELLKPIMKNHDNLTISTYAKPEQVDIKVTGKSKKFKELNKTIKYTIEDIKKIVGNYIYSYDNEKIEESLFKLLLKQNMKIAFCESCTGGLLASNFTKIPGVSQVFDRGIVTYSNKAKIEELGVKKETLEKYTAVSKETAFEMAKGLLNKSNVDMTISTTGYAGPKSDNTNEKVGLVYIGLATKDNVSVIRCNFTGDRETIQNKVATKAFYEARKYILNLN